LKTRNNDKYTPELERAYRKATEIVSKNEITSFESRPSLRRQIKVADEQKQIPQGGKTVAQAIRTIVDNIPSCKYLYSILATCLLVKIVNLSQDIRIAQKHLPGGYSNRSIDERYVTPFLKSKGLTACAASGTESGRNFERPLPYNINYPANPRGPGNKGAFLGILHAVQEENVNAGDCITLLLALDYQRKPKVTQTYHAPRDVTIDTIVEAVAKHFERSQGHNKSRLPVLAIYAAYQCIVPEMERFRGASLAPLEAHTTADLRSGCIGDIQVNKDVGAFEAVEVKSGIRFDEQKVLSLPRKFRGQRVNRYYMLTTAKEYVRKDQLQAVTKATARVRGQTGCQVIINGVIPSLKYYLRLVSNPEQFAYNYTTLLQDDESVQEEHRENWRRILLEIKKAHKSP